ncbi:SMODS domain-containing nucleotidyltransferase [Oerskovia enterophila]|uniref:Adenylyl/Guanylyl and SMODS C-terminal sensor domain-containing protein n=1 Tax=Oerskovia enterophila TaxID=43678 RepID=A0A161XCD2_9CELL|nr:nucleotidyltransferase [Oerskovia enterophila]KZM34257.1 hypothetical protein OJAG_30890 [Oerskovia enterophila]
MKLTAYFAHFLTSCVNLNDNRIARLNARVDSITSFLKSHPVFEEYFLDVIPQGSYAQRTIIKPVGGREFDADVLLALTEHPDWTPAQYTAELKKAFEHSTTYQGKAHKRTRCVYIDYADDFHIDVVPYVESRKGITHNKDDAWVHTDPEAFTAWFEAKSRVVGAGRLEAALRLLKYLRDTKTTFSIKSVLLTILAAGQVDSWRTTIDTKYYADLPTVFVHVLEDLDTYLQANPALPDIWDPAGTGQNFKERWTPDGYETFRTKIHDYAIKARAAYDDPNKVTSLATWQEIFGPAFTAPPVQESAAALQTSAASDPGEEFLDTDRQIPIRLTQTVKLIGRVRKAGIMRSYDLPTRGDRVAKNRDIDFYLEHCTVPKPYTVMWKVKNTGTEAHDARQLRGTIEHGDTGRHEHTNYAGSHYVEVYIIRDGVCVATDRQPVIVLQHHPHR